MEVPEIYDGTVQIRFAAAKAGERTKVAVMSRDKDVDPVGAWRRHEGMRVQSIIRELRGEKSTLFPYNEERWRVAQKALSPAKVRACKLPIRRQEARSDREDSQLSLASARKGERAPGKQAHRWDIGSSERGREAPGN